uniref:C-type lectin domain-containing protein n=1 Tax=Panagrolaimus davidi TaxID=227884 RepID=A0A914PEW5_9BILA
MNCNQIGGHLASVHDGFANALMAQEATNHFHESTVTDFWIGATNLFGQQRQWNWTDGTILDFNEWKKGEPENATGLECAALSTTDGYWTSQGCFKPKPFVCATSLIPAYPTNVNCSIGWTYFPPTHSCYGTNFGGFVGGWTAAENYCENFNSHLPSIHSIAEFQFLSSYVFASQYDFWTGIFSSDSGRTWRSSDESETDFLKYGSWCSGHPLNQTGERCVYIGRVTPISCYIDNVCDSYTYHTLCKKSI